ncbi:MAG: flavin reductase family protein, partial [Parvularculaceae bacterium]|nr:flavin reductase family protein [Parvularculaceae bacterium]
NSFTSASLSPPLVLWCIDRRAARFSAFMSADAYSINVLKAEQTALSEQFARHGPKPVDAALVTAWETGAPILKDALAAFDCRVVNRHGAGDHVVLIAEVVKFHAGSGKPLLYFASRYAEGPDAP